MGKLLRKSSGQHGFQQYSSTQIALESTHSGMLGLLDSSLIIKRNSSFHEAVTIERRIEERDSDKADEDDAAADVIDSTTTAALIAASQRLQCLMNNLVDVSPLWQGLVQHEKLKHAYNPPKKTNSAAEEHTTKTSRTGRNVNSDTLIRKQSRSWYQNAGHDQSSSNKLDRFRHPVSKEVLKPNSVMANKLQRCQSITANSIKEPLIERDESGIPIHDSTWHKVKRRIEYRNRLQQNIQGVFSNEFGRSINVEAVPEEVQLTDELASYLITEDRLAGLLEVDRWLRFASELAKEDNKDLERMELEVDDESSEMHKAFKTIEQSVEDKQYGDFETLHFYGNRMQQVKSDSTGSRVGAKSQSHRTRWISGDKRVSDRHEVELELAVLRGTLEKKEREAKLHRLLSSGVTASDERIMKSMQQANEAQSVYVVRTIQEQQATISNLRSKLRSVQNEVSTIARDLAKPSRVQIISNPAQISNTSDVSSMPSGNSSLSNAKQKSAYLLRLVNRNQQMQLKIDALQSTYKEAIEPSQNEAELRQKLKLIERKAHEATRYHEDNVKALQEKQKTMEEKVTSLDAEEQQVDESLAKNKLKYKHQTARIKRLNKLIEEYQKLKVRDGGAWKLLSNEMTGKDGRTVMEEANSLSMLVRSARELHGATVEADNLSRESNTLESRQTSLERILWFCEQLLANEGVIELTNVLGQHSKRNSISIVDTSSSCLNDSEVLFSRNVLGFFEFIKTQVRVCKSCFTRSAKEFGGEIHTNSVCNWMDNYLGSVKLAFQEAGKNSKSICENVSSEDDDTLIQNAARECFLKHLTIHSNPVDDETLDSFQVVIKYAKESLRVIQINKKQVDEKIALIHESSKRALWIQQESRTKLNLVSEAQVSSAVNNALQNEEKLTSLESMMTNLVESLHELALQEISLQEKRELLLCLEQKVTHLNAIPSNRENVFDSNLSSFEKMEAKEQELIIARSKLPKRSELFTKKYKRALRSRRESAIRKIFETEEDVQKVKSRLRETNLKTAEKRSEITELRKQIQQLKATYTATDNGYARLVGDPKQMRELDNLNNTKQKLLQALHKQEQRKQNIAKRRKADTTLERTTKEKVGNDNEVACNVVKSDNQSQQTGRIGTGIQKKGPIVLSQEEQILVNKLRSLHRQVVWWRKREMRTFGSTVPV